MRKICLIVAISFLIFLMLPTVSAHALQCPGCSGPNAYHWETYSEMGPNSTFCYFLSYIKSLNCDDCGYHEVIDTQTFHRLHTGGLWQTISCANGIHTWKETCTYCGYHLGTIQVRCPGPPRCVAPASVILRLPF